LFNFIFKSTHNITREHFRNPTMIGQDVSLLMAGSSDSATLNRFFSAVADNVNANPESRGGRIEDKVISMINACPLRVNMISVMQKVFQEMRVTGYVASMNLTDYTTRTRAANTIAISIQELIYPTIALSAPQISTTTPTNAEEREYVNSYEIPEHVEIDLARVYVMSNQVLSFPALDDRGKGVGEATAKPFKVVGDLLTRYSLSTQERGLDIHFQLTLNFPTSQGGEDDLYSYLTNPNCKHIAILNGALLYFCYDQPVPNGRGHNGYFNHITLRFFSSIVHMLNHANLVGFQQYEALMIKYGRALRNVNIDTVDVSLSHTLGHKTPHGLLQAVASYMNVQRTTETARNAPYQTLGSPGLMENAVSAFINKMRIFSVPTVSGMQSFTRFGKPAMEGYNEPVSGYDFRSQRFEYGSLSSDHKAFPLPPGTPILAMVEPADFLETFFKTVEFIDYLTTLKHMSSYTIPQSSEPPKELKDVYDIGLIGAEKEDIYARLVTDTTMFVNGRLTSPMHVVQPQIRLLSQTGTFRGNTYDVFQTCVEQLVTGSLSKNVTDALQQELSRALKKGVIKLVTALYSSHET
jgi:hypothetical protein